jgi:endonuclease/exonuclease/phosphatase family metal-dependent hydrolase
MKMLVCNIWGGRVFEELREYLLKEKDSTDLFLFQEMYDTPLDPDPFVKVIEGVRVNTLSELKRVMPEFEAYFAPTQEDAIGHDTYREPHMEFGNAMLVKKGITVLEHGHEFVWRFRNARETDAFSDGRNIEFIKIEKDGKAYTVVNFHGLWNGQGKSDSPERLQQSEKIKTFLEKTQGPKILAGDFNLLPETESIAIIERTGMRNLITEYAIDTTRSAKYYLKPLKFADYVFVSPEIEVSSFSVPKIDVSDHLPMILEFK